MKAKPQNFNHRIHHSSPHFFTVPTTASINSRVNGCIAVNLKGEHPLHRIDPTKPAREQEGRVYLPDNNTQGLQVQHWSPPPDDKPTGLFHFLIQIVNTMQNWRDQIQFPYPGYRDRIVQVSQLADEGGLNLNMPRENIERLADAGEHAAERLDARFRAGDGWATGNHLPLDDAYARPGWRRDELVKEFREATGDLARQDAQLWAKHMN